jgi:hypothetical protein
LVMRDDLLDAQACIDWTISQLAAFQERISSWLRLNVDIGVEDVPPPATHNPIVAIEKEPFPLAFNVEFGAYINVVRSSLDILATALAHRHGIPDADKMYFPVAKSAAAFVSGNYKGKEFIEGPPTAERAIIESLKPYQGGNESLWSLHQFDIQRKHRRLIDVEVRPMRFTMSGWGPLNQDFVPVATGWVRANEKTIIGLIRKNSPHYDMKFAPHVAVNEPGFAERRPVVATVNNFARTAEAIIRLFDT